MIPSLLLAAITAVILIGKGSAQNPNGDSLLCYINTIAGRPTPPVCLAAALSDGVVDIKGRSHKAGDIFGGACTKTPQVTWVVKNENGITSLRLKSDQTKCLTYKSSDPVAQLSPCQSGNKYQHNDFESHSWSTPYYTWSFYNGPARLYLSYDQARHRIKKAGVDTELDCMSWVWLSDVEKQAAAVRNKPFTFPVKGLTNPLRAQYAAAFVDQMVNNTRYPREVYNQDSLYNGCTGGPASCFPIDYDVGKGSETTNAYIPLDLTLKAGGVGYEVNPTKNLIPTGMFATPGQDVTIELDDFNTSRVAILAHLYMQDIPDGDAPNIIRPGHVALQDSLSPGVNTIRNIYGGPLTLEVIGTDPNNPSITAKITNTVPMATFILDVTTEEDWPGELAKEPSWIIFQGKYQAGLDIKAPYIGAKVSFAQVETMVKRYDILMKNNFLMSGYDLDANPGTVHAIPQGWMWWARDTTFDIMYAGNPIELAWFRNAKDMLLDWTNTSPWGIPHEFGHTFQTRCFSDLFGTEVTNNVYTVFQDSYFCNDGKFTDACGIKPTDYDLVGLLPNIKSHLSSGFTYVNMSNDAEQEAVYFWLQLVTHYGYIPHRNMQRRFREKSVNVTDTLCNGDEQGKYDAVYETWSEMVGEDLTKHFVTYGVPISKVAKGRVATKKYPQPSVDISNIEIIKGMPMTWNPNGDQPPFALPPYSTLIK